MWSVLASFSSSFEILETVSKTLIYLFISLVPEQQPAESRKFLEGDFP